MAKIKVLVCPYCGEAQPAADVCRACARTLSRGARIDILNNMGPWQVRDPDRPFDPGLSYTRLAEMVDAGEITRVSIVRGPTTRQLWTVAKRVPGVAHLLGYCHRCDEKVDPRSTRCTHCNALFGAWLDRNHLGLPDIMPAVDPGEPDETRDGPTQFREYEA